MRAFGRFIAIRDRKTNTGPVKAAQLLDEKTSLFPLVSTHQVVEELKKTGFASGFLLPTEVVENLEEFFASRPCYPDGNRETPIENVDAAAATGAVTAYYYNTMASPDMARIATDPKILNICYLYFGSQPYHLGNQAWWSFPLKSSDLQKSAFAQKFHFDLDGWRFLKFFFYISDVEMGFGEHVFVLESHKTRPMRFQYGLRRFSDEEVSQAFSASNIRPVIGSKGAGFVEDTFGVHKGTPPTLGRRLYFEIEYASSDYGTPNDNL